MVPYLAGVLKRFVVRKYADLRAPQVTSESSDGLDNAASFRVQRGLVPLGIEGRAPDTSNESYRAVRLFLFKRGPKTVGAGVAVHVEGAGAVGYGVPAREDQNRWGSELGQDLANDKFHSQRKDVLNPLPEKGGERAYPFGQVGQVFSIISHAAHQRTDLLEVRGHGHFHQSRPFVRIWTHTRRRNGAVQKICVRGAQVGFEGESLKLCPGRRSKRARIVLTWAVGSESKTITSSR